MTRIRCSSSLSLLLAALPLSAQPPLTREQVDAVARPAHASFPADDDAEVVRRLAKLPIRQRFREQFGYQNLMYLVAGLIVQRRSGTSWEEFVEQRFFAPLGMTATRASAQRLPADAEKALPHIDGQ